jgi:hypothetical protein
MQRRHFLRLAAGSGVLTALGDLAFLRALPPVSAGEARVDARRVRFAAGIEPLVRLLEDTPRERVLEEVASRIQRGLAYADVLAALLLAGVRNVQPRPVGFKFHAVLVVNSAHLAALASPETDRWLPIFWAIDRFKDAQAADAREGDWTLGPVDEPAVPPSHRARAAFIAAMDDWDEAAADAAIVGLVRSAGAHEVFEVLCRYGVRDFRDIGHKQIYLANSFRTLEAIGWHHAEAVLRSLTYALLDRSGAQVNPAKADLAADRPFRQSLGLVKSIGPGWLAGKPNPSATLEMLEAARAGSPEDAAARAVDLLNRGVAPHSILDACRVCSGELLMRRPGILSLHATTFANALDHAWQRCAHEETRKIQLLQAVAFLPLYRGDLNGGAKLDQLEPAPLEATGTEALAEIFAAIGHDRQTAARKLLAYLRQSQDPRPFADAARRLVFLKGRDSHDYKFSSAVFEDYQAMAAPWRDRFLAASVFHLKGSGEADNELVGRTRAAFKG